MTDTMGFEKIPNVSGTRGWPQVPVKGKMPSLKMGKHVFNGGWKCLWFQPSLEYPIEELVGDTRLKPEETSIVMQFCLREAAKEGTVSNQVGIKSHGNGDRRKILQ